MRRLARWLQFAPRPQRWTPLVLMAVVALIAIAVINSDVYFFVNQTPSIPRGLYREAADAPLERGAYVQYCPPARSGKRALRRGYVPGGDCPAETMMMGKRLVGMPGDTVRVTRRDVTVNGKALPKSEPMFEDGEGRPVKPRLGTRVMGPGEYFLFSGHHPMAYDSRYMGPVTDVRGVIRPVLTES
jgi:conjugative transfer signal peptidase TraF